MANTYYLDKNYRLHLAQDATESLLPWGDEAGFFAGKCGFYIEGFRVVPEGHTWTRPDGAVFRGPMLAPAAEISALLAAQGAYAQMAAETKLLQAQIAAAAGQNEFLEEVLAELILAVM